jgi:hypothetical protein
MEITINIDILNKNDLSLSEYVYLKSIYEERDKEEIRMIFKCIDHIEEDSLQKRGFIKLMPGGKVILRTATERLFNSGELFTKYLVMFPVKTPGGRYLSPLREETIAGDNIRKKWDQRFKNKPHKEAMALKVLDAELKWRRETNQMEFIHNAETWLHQGDYEKYEYLLDENDNEKVRNNKDFM